MTAEHLDDDFAAAIKAADDYADTLDELKAHDLPQPFKAWLSSVAHMVGHEHVITLRDAARTFGGRA